jgi:hypothetical protein
MAFNAVNSTNNSQIHNVNKIGGVLVGTVFFVKNRFFNKVFISKSLKKTGLKIKRIYA